MRSGNLSRCLYRAIMTIFAFFSPIYSLIRRLKGKDTAESARQKSGRYLLSRPTGKLLRIHGASIGETLSALPLIEAFLALDDHLTILVTSGTLTSAKVLKKRLPPRVIHQFAPLDTPRAVRGFYNYWRPNAEILLESEIWPHAVAEAKKRGIPLFLLNGRMSRRSFDLRRKYIPDFIAETLQAFTYLHVQDRENAARYKALGAERILVAQESAKWAARPSAPDMRALEECTQAWAYRPRFCVMSAAPEEFDYFADCFIALKKRISGLMCVFVPRHPVKAKKAYKAFAKKGVRVYLRSETEYPPHDAHVYIADTTGEAALWMSLCPVTFLGKSLFPPGGGQNPIEPLHYNSAILTGPHVANFEKIYADAEKARSLIRPQTVRETEDAIYYLLKRPDFRTQAVQNGRVLLTQKRKIACEELNALAQAILSSMREKIL